jgi:hypothetical protein
VGLFVEKGERDFYGIEFEEDGRERNEEEREN